MKDKPFVSGKQSYSQRWKRGNDISAEKKKKKRKKAMSASGDDAEKAGSGSDVTYGAISGATGEFGVLRCE